VNLVGVLGGNDVGVDCNVRAREESAERAQIIVHCRRRGGGRRGPALPELRRGEGDGAAVPTRGGGGGASAEEAAGEEG
jgi:hypothetical protein